MKNLFFKNKNSQVAMEFLMTYGWALLVVLIAIAALVFFGLLEPSRFLPEKIELPAGFIVQGSAWDGQDNVLDIFVYNGIGQRVTDFQLEIEGCSPSDSVRIIPGSTEKITVFCDDITAKARFNSDIRVSYKTTTAGHELSRGGIGRISINIDEVFVCETGASGFHGGAGSLADPWQICNCEQLQNMNENLNSHYKLIRNIYCTDTKNWNGGAGFEPVGIFGISFEGSFDGSNYIINDLYINRPAINDIGLFGAIDGAEISNVGLKNVNIIGAHNTGALLGTNDNGNVQNTFSTGFVSGNLNVGGLVGSAGWSFNENIYNSYSTATVSGENNVGGLIGEAYYANVYHSYSTGNVFGSGGNIGGFIGYDEDSFIQNCGWYTGSGGDVSGAIGFSAVDNYNVVYETSTISNFYDSSYGIYSTWDSSIWEWKSNDFPKFKIFS